MTLGVKNPNLIKSDLIGNQIRLRMTGFKTLFISENFSYKAWFVPYSGKVVAEIDDVSLDILISPIRHGVNGRGKLVYRVD